MKRTIFFCFGIILFSTCVQAQSFYRKNHPNNVVKVSLLSPLVSTLSLFFEKAIDPHTSVQLGVAYTGASGYYLQGRGITITPEYRIFVQGDSPQLSGLFVAPFLRYRYITTEGNYIEDGTYYDVALHTYGLGFLLGYQQMYDKRFTLTGYLGPDYNFPYWQKSVGLENVSNTHRFPGLFFTGFGLRLGVTLGFAFQ